MHLAACVLAAAAVTALAVAQEGRSMVVSLFDGATLAGWDGDPAVWSVHDGCIRGSTALHAIERNTFLVWTGGEVADFDLSLEVRLEGDNNSGIQYRSRRVVGEPFAVLGYQCDVHPRSDYLGMLYDEGGGGIVATRGERRVRGALAGPTATAAGTVDLAQWHRVRIVARGTTVQHWLGGEQAIEVVDDAMPRRGGLALQVHHGAPMTVWFRNLQLTPLRTEEVAQVPPPRGVPQWIWDAAVENGEEVFFRREFELPSAPRAATLAFSCDNHARVLVNGQRVASSDAWEQPQLVAIDAHLRAGRNVVAVHASNDGSAAGLCAEATWTLADGAAGGLATDANWRCNGDDPDGWDAVGFADGAWPMATAQVPLGQGPWARVLTATAFADLRPDPMALVAVPAPELELAPGLVASRVVAVPRMFGSWVCMTSDDRGRLYASDQRRGLYRVTLASASGAPSNAPAIIEPIDLGISGCQGLCWAFGALYAVVNGERSGLYRLRDTDGDDRLDRAELLRALEGDGEHGPHAVVAAPDGTGLLVLCGNHTAPPELAASRVPQNWQEDALPRRIDDPNGHAVGITAPGGYVCRVDPDGEHWELLCCGFRNAYDLAVLANGEVFTFDADMEWDMGLPWYRPTRILQVLSGVDYGWRSGSAKWATDVPDTVPAVVDVGPASPTGLLPWAGSVLALDWTFGTAWRIDLQTAGAGYRGTATAVVRGKPLPLVDAVGAGTGRGCYVLTGGRGLPSAIYQIAASAGTTAPAAVPAPPRRAERLLLESFHGRVDEQAIAVAWPGLGEADPVLAHAARIAVESQPVATWRERALAEPVASAAGLAALLALARAGTAADLPQIVLRLGTCEFAALPRDRQIAWLRVQALALLRHGPADAATAAVAIERLQALFPCGDDRLDADLGALLAHLQAPAFVASAVPLLAPLRPIAPPDWSDTAARSAAYGPAIARLLAAPPPAGQLALANALRGTTVGWTTLLRRQFFAFLQAARRCSGGASYGGYLQRMVDDVWATCSTAEQQELAVVAGKQAEPAAFVATPPKGPGRAWQLDEAAALLRTDRGARDLTAGRNLFHATGCAACHRFHGEGGGVGPDLTSLANKFRPVDVLEAVLEPSRVVSDQFAGTILTRRDGTTHFGQVSVQGNGDQKVYRVVTATKEAACVEVAAADVTKVERAPLSPMPAGLVNGLNQQELLDLLAFLLAPDRR